jgi:hypothetical protein
MSGIDPQTILQSSQAYANEMKGDVITALQKLMDYTLYLPYDFTFSDPLPFEPVKTPPISIGDLPVLEKTVFNADFVVKDVSAFTGHSFVAPMLGNLESRFWTIVSNGGTFMDPAVQDAMFNATRDRDLQTLRDALDVLHDDDAAFGFPIPTDTYIARENELTKKYMDTRNDRNREITALIADLVQKAIIAASDGMVKIEELHATFTLGLGNLYAKLADTILNNARLELEARLGEFDGQLKAITAGYAVQEANARLDLGYWELLKSKWAVETQSLIEKAKTIVEMLDDQTKIRLAALTTFSAVANASLSSSLLQTSGISVVQSKGGSTG